MMASETDNKDETKPVEIKWITTDGNQKIELARYSRKNDNSPQPLIATYNTFFSSLSQPDPYIHTKDGPAFLIGPCRGVRSGRNIEKAWVAVIDADKSIGEKGIPVNGAPPPLQVHEALARFNLSHCLYTTHSHGSDLGHRYRIVIPVELSCVEELQAITTYVVELLNRHSDLPLALSRESFVWGQGWFLPRTAYEDAEFYSASHLGGVPDPAALAKVYGLSSRQDRRLPQVFVRKLNGDESPIRMFERVMPITTLLADHDYRFVSQGVMTDYDGEDVPVLRYVYPESTSGSPGVVVFYTRGHWRCWSHHSNDPLNNGHANDAFDVFKILNGIESDQVAFMQAVEQIQADVIGQLNEEYPSIMEGGSKFKFGNKYVNEFGAMEYRLMDMAAFGALMTNQPGVPVLRKNENGEEFVAMCDRFEFWKRARERTLYNGLRYCPTPINKPVEDSIEAEGKLYFNTFRTWHMSPIKGRYPLLEWHLQNAICGGCNREYEWLLNWFAHLFQRPDEKPGVAVILQGGRGTGKTIVFSELAKKLGTHAFVAGNNRLLTGNFNSHLRNKLLLVVEESFWAGNHADRGKLQHLITDQVGAYEKKGVDAEAGISYLRVVMVSNEDWVAPAASDERRYFIPTLTECSREADIVDGKKGHFFPRLLAELRGGGLEAFVYDLIRRPLDESLIRTVPDTLRLRQQKELSMDWLDRWFMESLTIAKIRSKTHGIASWTDAGCAVSHEALKESLTEAAPGSLLHSDHGLMTQLGIRVAKVLKKELVRKEGDKWIFAGISQCRAVFERKVGFTIDWGQQILPSSPPIEESPYHGRSNSASGSAKHH